MSCTDSQIVCQLRQIATDLQPTWDWNSFWATFIATVAGVVVSGLIAYLIFRGQVDDQYEARLDDALVKVLYAENETFRELEKLNTEEGRRTDPAALGLNPHVMLTAILAARLLARGKDIEVVRALQDMLHSYYRMGVSLRMVIGQQLAAILTRWRTGELSAQDAITACKDTAASMDDLIDDRQGSGSGEGNA